jgi:Ca-activated chloride channel family protein
MISRTQLLLLLVLGLTAVVHAQQPPGSGSKDAPSQVTHKSEEVSEGDVLRINTNLVTIPFLVVDRQGRAVVDLQQKDFRIFENDVEQNIAHFRSVGNPFSVVLLIDTSGSTAPFLMQIKEAAKAFVEQLRPSDVVRPVYFHGEIRSLINAGTDDRELLAAAIDRIQAGPIDLGTRLYDAVDYSLSALKSESKRKAVILLTDGENTWGKATMKGTLHGAEESGVIIYAVQYDQRPTEKYLQELCHRTGGRFFKAADISLIRQSFAGIADELRRQYLIGYYANEETRRGERKVKVKVNRKNSVVVSRRTFGERKPN